MFEDLQRELNHIAAGIPDWRKTKILNSEGGILGDARKFLDPDWWKRSQPRDEQNRDILRILDRAGLHLVDGVQEENQQFHPKGEARTGTSASEIAEHQRDKRQRDREAGVNDELAPTETESLSDWFARLAKAIDANGSKKIFFDALRAHASRYRGDSLAKNLDGKLVQAFLKNVSGD